jgi:O-antigen ligase
LDSLPPWYVGVMAALVMLVVPLALLRYQTYLVIGGLVALMVLVLIVTEPFVGLLIFLGLLYMRPEEYIPALAGARMTLLVSVIALFAWMINALLCKERFRFHLPAVQCFVGFLVVAIGSTAFSGTADIAEQTLELIKLFTLFVLVVHLVSTRARLRASLAIMVLFSASLGLLAISKYQNGEGIWDDGKLRAIATGIFADPNDLSLAMAMALPLALGMVMARGSNWFERVLGFASVPIFFYTTYLSDSRGGMLALAASLFLFFRRRLGRWGIVLGVIGVLGLFAFGPSRMSEMSAQEESAAGRVHAWHAGMEMLQSSPLWGVGTSQFEMYHFRTAHNSLVLCMAEVGLIGTLFWIGLFYFNFRDGKLIMRARQREQEEIGEVDTPTKGLRTQHDVTFLLQISLMTFMVGGFFLSRTYTVPLYVYLGLAVAAMQVAGMRTDDRCQMSDVSEDRTSSRLTSDICHLSSDLERSTARDWRNIMLMTGATVPFIVILVRLWS